MADFSPTILLTASDTAGSPRSITVAGATHYTIKNRSSIGVIARAIAGGDTGTAVRIRPNSEGTIMNGDIAITALEFYLQNSPRFVRADGTVVLAQAANIEITRH